MIFGKTAQQKLDAFHAKQRPWHRWFAWRPIALPDGRYVWLQNVNRRRYIFEGHYREYLKWDYRAI